MVHSIQNNRRCDEPKSRSSKLANVALGSALATMLLLSVGCASYNQDHFTVGSVPDDYRSRHPIIVSENEKVNDIVVPVHSRNMSSRDLELVRSMGSKFRQSGSQHIAILVPTGSRNERAARNFASNAISELKRIRIPENRIVVQYYNAEGHSDSATLRLVYADLNAEVVGECGEWSEDLMDTSNNENYSNFGCATQNNLAKMIASPADLLGPRGESHIDASRRAKVIDDWRNGGSSAF